MKRTFILFLTIFLVGGGVAFAETPAQEIETLLATDAVSYAQAARFVLEASSAERAFILPEEAFQYAMGHGWLPKNARPEEIARLDGVSFLLMNSFGLKGGMMYSLFKNPHFAYRELVYKNFITGFAVSSMPVSGEMLLSISNRLIEREDSLREAAEREAQRRREAMAAEIAVMLIEQEVADTTVEVTDTGVTITLSDIQFMADSAELYPSEIEKLQEIANILSGILNIRLQISGHTALAGTPDARLRISLQRALAVGAHLVSLGAVEARNISAMGFGGERPVASNATPEGMALNRRVEITILENAP